MLSAVFTFKMMRKDEEEITSKRRAIEKKLALPAPPDSSSCQELNIIVTSAFI